MAQAVERVNPKKPGPVTGSNSVINVNKRRGFSAAALNLLAAGFDHPRLKHGGDRVSRKTRPWESYSITTGLNCTTCADPAQSGLRSTGGVPDLTQSQAVLFAPSN